MQLCLVEQCELEGIGDSLYCLQNHILIGDVGNGWSTPSCILLTLLGHQSIRDCHQMTHSLEDEKSLEKAFGYTVCGRKKLMHRQEVSGDDLQTLIHMWWT